MGHLPLERGALEATLAPLGDALGLPSDAYISRTVFEWEMRAVLDASWVCVGRTADLPAPIGQKVVRAGSETVLVTRDDESIRAFFNVCRHRGHELAEPGPARTSQVVRCPYHSWVYGMDGRVRSGPDAIARAAGADELRLVPVRLEQWHGWVFVNADGRSPPLRECVGSLEDIVAPYAPEDLACAVRRTYEVRANWKIICENYHECYHCRGLHPQLCRVSPPDSGVNVDPDGSWVGGWMDLAPGAQTMSLDGRSAPAFLPSISAGDRRRVAYFQLFPNLLMSLHPDYVLTYRLDAVECDVTIVDCEWLFALSVAGDEIFDPSYAVDFWDVVNRQDWRACESVQRGMNSRAFRPGALTSREDAVHAFMSMVARTYIDAV